MAAATSDAIKPLVSPWFPETDTNRVRALGKTLEELGELTSAVSRCLIQGIDACEPVTGKPNRLWLQQEVADVYAQLAMLDMQFGLDTAFINKRMGAKIEQMHEWRTML